MVEAYRDERRQQPSKRKPNQTVKGATVNRELECLKCMLDFATKRRYIAENPASEVKHFNELRERPTRRMLSPTSGEKQVTPYHCSVDPLSMSTTCGSEGAPQMGMFAVRRFDR
jgi:hypothetical protein